MRRKQLLLSLSAVMVLASAAFSQTAPPFTIQIQQGANRFTIADGGSVALPADAVGMLSAASVTLTYTGTATSVSVNTTEVSGHADFSLAGLPELPASLAPRQSVTFYVRYLPTTSTRVQGRVAVNYTEGRTSGTITINLVGTAPEFAFSYIPPGGNATPLSPGGTVSFPATTLNSTASAVFIITNRGSGAGTVNQISYSGAAFQLAGLPLPPTTVEAGKELRFTIQFTPKQLDASQGALEIELVGRKPSFRLEGSGSGPVYVYELVQPSGAVTLTPNQLIAMPPALVGDKSSLIVRVRNNGNADGTISTISVQGAGFTLGDVPFLPLTLAPGGSASFTIAFTPTQPGNASARLRVGSDSFDVTGTGLGATLAYSYAIGAASTTVQPGGTIVFTPAAVGRTSSLRFVISNNGTAPAVINSISLGAANIPFALADLPSLPVTVAAGASVSFTIQFAPATVGVATASLKVDTQSFTLSGSGDPPEPLPSYRFTAPSGPQQSMQQISVGLSLESAYPLALNGTLTLKFNSEVFSDDPAVQFATGGRTVSFTIPANSTRAVFPQGANEIKIQTGTVAGAITLTPSFTSEGGINLTPANPPSLSLTVPQSAPRLLSVAISSRASNTLTLLVSGYSTSRSITQMDFQFTAVAGENLGTAKLTLNAEPSFLAWYQSSQSQQYGSLFTATVPFTLQGDVKNVSSLTDAIQSVSVTLTNRLGTSAAVSVSLR